MTLSKAHLVSSSTSATQSTVMPTTSATKLSIEDFANSYREYSRFRPRATAAAYSEGGVIMEDCPHSFPFLKDHLVRVNLSGRLIVLLSDQLEACQNEAELKRYIEGIKMLAAGYQITWRVSKEATLLAACLESKGFIVDEVSTMMCLTKDDFKPQVKDTGLNIQCSGDTILSDFCYCQSEDSTFFTGHNMQSQAVKSGLVQFYVGYHKGEPVTCVQIIGSPFGVTGLHAVKTVPQARHKGYASAILSRCIGDLFSQGTEIAVLAASNGSENLYSRLGFRQVGQFTSFKSL